LATSLIRLSGLEPRDAANPDGDIEITFSGLRPGEKLFEELFIDTDHITSTQHPKIMRSHEDAPNWDQMQLIISRLEEAIKAPAPALHNVIAGVVGSDFLKEVA